MFTFIYCGKSSVGESFPLPSPSPVKVRPPELRCKSTPTPANLPMCLFSFHYLGLTPWKIPTSIATGGVIENPSDLMTTFISTLTLILLKTRKVRYLGILLFSVSIQLLTIKYWATSFLPFRLSTSAVNFLRRHWGLQFPFFELGGWRRGLQILTLRKRQSTPLKQSVPWLPLSGNNFFKISPRNQLTLKE